MAFRAALLALLACGFGLLQARPARGAEAPPPVPAPGDVRLTAIPFPHPPVIDGSLTELAQGASETGTAVGAAQTGFLRSYALAIAVSVAVLVIVFVSVR